MVTYSQSIIAAKWRIAAKTLECRLAVFFSRLIPSFELVPFPLGTCSNGSRPRIRRKTAPEKEDQPKGCLCGDKIAPDLSCKASDSYFREGNHILGTLTRVLAEQVLELAEGKAVEGWFRFVYWLAVLDEVTRKVDLVIGEVEAPQRHDGLLVCPATLAPDRPMYLVPQSW